MSDLNTDEQVDVDDDASTSDYPAWMSQLPDEYKKDEYGKGYKTMGEFYKTHKGLRAKIDKMPKAPEKASEYEFADPDEESGIKVDPNAKKWFSKTAFKLKMPKEMAEEFYTEYSEFAGNLLKSRDEQMKKELEKSDELMHGEWGEDFDTNMKYVEKAIDDLGGDELREVLEKAGIDNHPAILKAFKQVGFEHKDDTIKEGVVTGPSKEWTLADEYPSMGDDGRPKAR